MKQELIKKMIEQKRLKLSFWQTIGHYAPAFILLFVAALNAYGLPTGELISDGLFFFIIAIIFSFIQWHRLTFMQRTIKHTENDFDEAVKRTAKQLEWKIEIRQKKLLKINRPPDWGDPYGEIITIIKDGDRLLLNSICDPRAPSITAWGWNRKNIRTFLNNLNDVVNHIPAPQIKQSGIPEKEWTLKKLLTRLIAYPFCVFLIGFSAYSIIYDNRNYLFVWDSYRNTWLASMGIFIASAYLYSDLRIIFTKRQKHELLTSN